jgi:hypothetical protein
MALGGEELPHKYGAVPEDISSSISYSLTINMD